MSKKPGKRREAREAAIQFLFSYDINRKHGPKEIADFWRIRPLKESARSFSIDLIEGTLGHLEAIDEALTKAIDNYRLERLSVVDRNILRLATYEILFQEQIPVSVSINEAIEIAKRFGTPDSGAFVNGILDSVRNTNTT